MQRFCQKPPFFRHSSRNLSASVPGDQVTKGDELLHVISALQRDAVQETRQQTILGIPITSSLVIGWICSISVTAVTWVLGLFWSGSFGVLDQQR